MAELWSDDFETGSIAGWDTPSNGLVHADYAKNGDYGLLSGDIGARFPSDYITAEATFHLEITMGFWTKIVDSRAGDMFFVGFYNDMALKYDATNENLSFWNHWGAGEQVAAANGTLPLNVWAYVELYVLFHNTAGVVEIRQNGVVVASGTGLDLYHTLEPGTDYFRFGRDAGLTSPYTVHTDDIYINSGYDFNGVTVLKPAAATGVVVTIPTPTVSAVADPIGGGRDLAGPGVMLETG